MMAYVNQQGKREDQQEYAIFEKVVITPLAETPHQALDTGWNIPFRLRIRSCMEDRQVRA